MGMQSAVVRAERILFIELLLRREERVILLSADVESISLAISRKTGQVILKRSYGNGHNFRFFCIITLF
jgi:hypothetical protein